MTTKLVGDISDSWHTDEPNEGLQGRYNPDFDLIPSSRGQKQGNEWCISSKKSEITEEQCLAQKNDSWEIRLNFRNIAEHSGAFIFQSAAPAYC